ncbi:AAA family ATPase, partial [Cronobacter sakazakii]|nr:AAA family ATPase [Cronobacter sakazakii]
GARPKMGKTTVYQKMAIHCALVENLPTLAFSLEMPTEQLVERIISQHSRVKSDVFYQNGYNENQFAQALAMGTQIADSNNLYIDDTPGLSLAHIVSESRRIKRERGEVGMVLVDYLTLMAAEKADTESQAYGIITKGLKILAKELNCVVVLLTQLNRGSEARANKRPLPSDSRSTGQIEQDCDYWLGIYRENEDDETVNPAETELLLRLNRHGNTGTVYVEQRNGILYDIDQQEARFRKEERERKPNKKGGF